MHRGKMNPQIGWALNIEGHKFRIFREECDRSGLLHCPACDNPVIEELDSVMAVHELARGFVPGHRGCRTRPRPFDEKSHWKSEARKHRRALRDAERRDEYLDFVEKRIEKVRIRVEPDCIYYSGGTLPHCPSCDRPFDWDTEGAQAQFEAGLVPGHPMCSCHPQEWELEEEMVVPSQIQKAS